MTQLVSTKARLPAAIAARHRFSQRHNDRNCQQGVSDLIALTFNPNPMKSTLVLRLMLAALGMSCLCPQSQAQKTRIVIDGGAAKKKDIALDPLFAPGKLWSCTPELLDAEWKGKGFKWASEQSKDRGMIRRERSGFETLQLNLFSNTQSVEEVVFLMKNGKCAEVQIAVWNKGDSEKAEISQKDFNDIVQRIVTELSTRIAPRFQNLGKDTQSAAKAERLQWLGTETIAQLEYSSGKDNRGVVAENVIASVIWVSPQRRIVRWAK